MFVNDKRTDGSYYPGMTPSGDAHRLSLKFTDGAFTSYIKHTLDLVLLIDVNGDSRLRNLLSSPERQPASYNR